MVVKESQKFDVSKPGIRLENHWLIVGWKTIMLDIYQLHRTASPLPLYPHFAFRKPMIFIPFMLLLPFAQALTFPKWRHPQSISYSLVHPKFHRTATTLCSSISSSLDDVNKRMKAIEWCLMTKGTKDEVPPIDISDFVLFYKNMNKDNLEKLYVDLQEGKTALQEGKTAPSMAAVGSNGMLRWYRI